MIHQEGMINSKLSNALLRVIPQLSLGTITMTRAKRKNTGTRIDITL